MHENKCLWLHHSPSSFSGWGVGRAGGHVPIDLSLCLCVHPHQPHPIHSHSLPLTSPIYTLPARSPPFTPSGALYHDVVSFTRGMVVVVVGVGVGMGGEASHLCSPHGEPRYSESNGIISSRPVSTVFGCRF